MPKRQWTEAADVGIIRAIGDRGYRMGFLFGGGGASPPPPPPPPPAPATNASSAVQDSMAAQRAAAAAASGSLGFDNTVTSGSAEGAKAPKTAGGKATLGDG